MKSLEVDAVQAQAVIAKAQELSREPASKLGTIAKMGGVGTLPTNLVCDDNIYSYMFLFISHIMVHKLSITNLVLRYHI